MHITWVTRSFLDYRIPIYERIDSLCGNQLSLIYNGEVVPQHLTKKMKKVLGSRCIDMTGEIRLIGKAMNPVSNSNGGGRRIPIQKGLYKKIRESNPDVILSDGFFQWTLVCVIYKMFHPKVRHVMCYEGWSHTERHTGRLNTLYRKFAGHFIDAICCNGVLSKEYVKGLGYPENKISLGNMAADTSFFKEGAARVSDEMKVSFRSQYHLNEVVYIFSGRLVQLKGIAELFVAWKTFIEGKEDKVSLLLVGDGPQRDDLENYCKENHLTNVVFAGRVDYNQLPLYYTASSVFVIPTLQDNWSLVVPEAMSCGLPIICSIYNGCWPELVKPENGWTFDPLLAESVSSVLNESYAHRDEFATMGEESQHIVVNHTPQHAAQNIMEACKYVTRNNK